MINKPSLLDSPNLANRNEFTGGIDPVDECYAHDSPIKGDYDGTDASEWRDGKAVQETLPAAQWDAMIHDLTALGYQLTAVTKSMWEELYSVIHGEQPGMSHELFDSLSSTIIGANRLYMVDRNTDTYATVKAAIDAGKIPVLKYGGKYLIATAFSATEVAFTAAINRYNIAMTRLTSQDVWVDMDTVTLADLASAQVFTNKIIDKRYNRIKSTPLVVSETQTYIPEKEQNIVIDTAGVVLTLGSGPYIGFEQTLLATASCSVVRGSITDSLENGDVITYVWNGTAWGVKPGTVLTRTIVRDTTINPTTDMVIITESMDREVYLRFPLVLTIGQGAYEGQKLTFVVKADDDEIKTYIIINGVNERFINGQTIEIVYNGSAWNYVNISDATVPINRNWISTGKLYNSKPIYKAQFSGTMSRDSSMTVTNYTLWTATAHALPSNYIILDAEGKITLRHTSTSTYQTVENIIPFPGTEFFTTTSSGSPLFVSSWFAMDSTRKIGALVPNGFTNMSVSFNVTLYFALA